MDFSEMWTGVMILALMEDEERKKKNKVDEENKEEKVDEENKEEKVDEENKEEKVTKSNSRKNSLSFFGTAIIFLLFLFVLICLKLYLSSVLY